MIFTWYTLHSKWFKKNKNKKPAPSYLQTVWFNNTTVSAALIVLRKKNQKNIERWFKWFFFFFSFSSQGKINAQIDAVPDLQISGHAWQLAIPAYTHAYLNRPACFAVNSWLGWINISWQSDTSSPPCSINSLCFSPWHHCETTSETTTVRWLLHSATLLCFRNKDEWSKMLTWTPLP